MINYKDLLEKELMLQHKPFMKELNKRIILTIGTTETTVYVHYKWLKYDARFITTLSKYLKINGYTFNIVSEIIFIYLFEAES